MIDLSEYPIDEPTKVEIDFMPVGRHPAGTTEMQAVQREADDYAAAFSGSLPSEKVEAKVITLDGPGGGSPVVEFSGELIRVASLFAAYHAEAYMNVEDSLFANAAVAAEAWMKDKGTFTYS